MPITDNNYNPAIGSVGGKYRPADIDSTGATSGQVVKYNGTAVVWGDETVDPGELALTNAHVLVGNASNVAADVALSGDVSIANDGETTVDSIDLETATVTGIADTEILVGTGAGTAAFVALSGDATMDNTGAVEVSDLTIASEAAGDVLYFNGTNWIKLAIGTAGQVLTVNGGGTAPIWATP